MNVLQTLENVITHPVTAVSAGVGAVSTVFQVPYIDAVVGTLWGNAGTVFAGASVISGTFANYLGLSPAAQAAIIFVAGVLWLGRIIDRLTAGVQKRLKDE